MEEQFVTYNIALKLKELGFNEKCFALFDAYNENNLVYLSDGKNKMGNIMLNSSMDYSCTAPLWQQVIDWFEDEHQLVLQYDDRTGGSRGATWLSPAIIKLTSYGTENATPCSFRNKVFYNKYDAREQTVLKAIELIENNITNLD